MKDCNYLGWTYKTSNIKDEDYVWIRTANSTISGAVNAFERVNGKCLNKVYIFRKVKPNHLKQLLTH